MDKYEIRRLNLVKLMQTHCNNSIKNLANQLGKDHSYVSRLLYQEGKKYKKNIADRVTTDIEHAFNLPRGWLDGLSSNNLFVEKPFSEQKSNPIASSQNEIPLGRDEIAAPFYKSIDLAFGKSSTNNKKAPSSQLRFTTSFLRKKEIKQENIVCFSFYGDSMEPRIPNGATVAIDMAKKEIIDGDIYAICQGELYRIKRLYRMPHNKIRINSYNSVNNPDEIDDQKNIQILGRVFYFSTEL